MENKEIEKKKELEKLGVMRIVALAVLGFALYWVFSDIELSKMEMRLLPMFYVLDSSLYVTKKLTVLVVPLLFAIALWIPRYGSYLLIRSVLYTEGIKYIALFVYYFIATMSGVLFAAIFYQGAIPMLIGVGFYLWLIKVLHKEMKTEEYKQYFRVEGKEEKKLKAMAIILAVALYAGVYGAAILEKWVQPNYAAEWAKENEAKVTVYDKIKLTERKPYGKSFREISTYTGSVISPDGKKLMLVYEGTGIEGLEFYDIASGEKIRRLDILAPSALFTPDGENIIWMNYDRLGERKKISFEVINMETGEINRDFQDRTFLKKEREEKKSEEGWLYIQFSPNNKYFTALVRGGKGGGVELWDYHTGKLLDYYGIGEGVGDLLWLSDNKFITVKKTFDQRGKLKDKEVILNEILPDGKIKRTKQDKIVEQMKTSGILEGHIGAAYGEKEVLIVYSRENTFGRRSRQMVLCDLETGQIKFGLTFQHLSSYEIDDRGNLVVVESMEAGKLKITLWDINQRAKKKVLYANVENWLESSGPPRCWFIDGGKKLAFVQKKIYIVDLE